MNYKHFQQPIGVFDSGVGGLTVMKELLRQLPNESFIYFGDTARLPYGEKSPDAIIRYSLENTRFLIDKDVKMLVVACNTASAYALKELQLQFNLPIFGVIHPSANKALLTSKNGRIGVLGTKGTIESQVYQKAFFEKSPQVTIITIACPLLVPLVEENYIDHPITQFIINEYLNQLNNHQIDTLLLGCTHYLLLRNSVQEILGHDVAIVDSAAACAHDVASFIAENQWQNRCAKPKSAQYYVSDNPLKFQSLGQTLLNLSIPHVHLVSNVRL